jgi:hypothetical protein
MTSPVEQEHEQTRDPLLLELEKIQQLLYWIATTIAKALE